MTPDIKARAGGAVDEYERVNADYLQRSYF
jgi:hypothetical protein